RCVLHADQLQPDGRGRTGLPAGGAGHPQRRVRGDGASYPHAAGDPRGVLGGVSGLRRAAMETGRPARETVRAACFAEVDHLRVDGPVRWLRGLVAACMAMLAWPAQAWSEMGHRMVGDLAEWRLSEAARAEVRELLEGEREASLGAVAAWADALRHEDPARFAISRNWHFINAEGGGCGFDEARDCPGGDCIVSAINTQRRILADRPLPRSQRRDALKFIVHLVGDVHQPLHAGSREDRGGNQYQVSLRRGGEGRRGEPVGTNLHTVWDSHVLSSAGL